MNAPPRRSPRDLDPRLLRMAREEIDAVLQALPPDIAQHADSIPLAFEPAPGPDRLREGLDPDLLGLFVGLDFVETAGSAQDLPGQIILFLHNLWDYTHHLPRRYREEVRTTYLHELGHYLGLDEDDLTARDLQ